MHALFGKVINYTKIKCMLGIIKREDEQTKQYNNTIRSLQLIASDQNHEGAFQIISDVLRN